MFSILLTHILLLTHINVKKHLITCYLLLNIVLPLVLMCHYHIIKIWTRTSWREQMYSYFLWWNDGNTCVYATKNNHTSVCKLLTTTVGTVECSVGELFDTNFTQIPPNTVYLGKMEKWKNGCRDTAKAYSHLNMKCYQSGFTLHAKSDWNWSEIICQQLWESINCFCHWLSSNANHSLLFCCTSLDFCILWHFTD